MKFYSLLGVLLVGFMFLVCLPLNGQISFNETSYDFGVIPEEAGRVSFEFNYKNDSNDSIRIDSVTPSCGCIATAGDYEWIMNQGSGAVKLTFNPLNRPGTFSKETLVKFSNGESKRLHITGFVTSADIPLTKVLPFESGVLRLKTNRINLGNLPQNSSKTITLLVANESDHFVKINKASSYMPQNIRIDDDFEGFLPHQFSILKINYQATEVSGYHEQVIHLATNDAAEPTKSIEIVSNVYPVFGQEKIGDAKLTLDKTVKDFGNVNVGDSLVAQFQVTNTGTSDLEISSIEPNCACLKVSAKKILLIPNQTSILEVRYEPSQITGRQLKAVHLYSNAVNGYLHRLLLRADVD